MTITLVGHSHNYIGERLGGLIARNIQNRFFSFYEEREQEKVRLAQKFSIELMEKFLDNENLGWNNEEQIARLFKNIILSGHKIAIASFNDYPHAVKYALERLLGKEDAAKIYIKSVLSSNNFEEIQNCTKKEYIREIIIIPKSLIKNVFFMDADIKHVNAAKDYGITVVLVKNKGTEHIHETFNFLYEFNEQYEIYVELEEPATEPLLSDEESTYLSPEAIKAISFEPISSDYYSDGEYTPWGGGDVPMLGKG